MKTTKAKELLEKYEQGICTDEEKSVVETWYLKHEVLNPIAISEEERLTDVYKIWDHLSTTLAQPETKPVSHRLWYQLLAAASIILVLGIGFYQYAEINAGNKRELAMNSIPAGKNAATLILANGRKINLSTSSNGAIAAEAGVNITKTADGQIVYNVKEVEKKPGTELAYNTVSTPKGGQYQVKLPDGSRVWLNAASQLKFPASFAGLKERRVTLSGEAYFKVEHNAKQPFRVHTGGQLVEDLGTEFNINGYVDENSIKTTLLEGSVSIAPVMLNSSKRVFRQVQDDITLVPGQQAIFSRAGSIKVQAADTQEAIAWKNGDFVFRNTDFRTVMRKVARWYDVEVVYDASAPMDIPLGGLVSRSKNISVLLNLMEATGAVHFKVEGRKITVSK